MNWLDIIIIIALIISVISGIVQGLIKTAASLIGLILGIFIAGRYYEPFSNVLSFISNENAAHIVAFIIIFLAVIIIVTILGIVISKIVRAIMLGWLDHLLGAVAGLISGAFFIAAILALCAHFLGDNQVIAGSLLAQFLLDKFPIALGLLPAEFDTVSNYFK
jgi:membrane protein required for colicin V production